MLESAADRRSRHGIFCPFSVVALHRAEREPQRERGVGIGVAAARLELRVGDLRVGLPQRLVDLVFVLLAQLARARVDHARDPDHRIVRRVDRRLAAFAELLARGDVLQLRAAHQLRGALLRRLAGEHLRTSGSFGADVSSQCDSESASFTISRSS